MIVCGIKLSHDAAVAVVDGRRLIGCIEAEKVDNNARHETIGDWSTVESFLERMGVEVGDVDRFVVDGWYMDRYFTGPVNASRATQRRRLRMGSYHEGGGDPLQSVDAIDEAVFGRRYETCTHAASHVLAAYATSPFAARLEASYVVVWDGGMGARCYYVDPVLCSIRYVGTALELFGNIYPLFASQLEPFIETQAWGEQQYLGVAGRVMAYAALGELRDDVTRALDRMVDDIGRRGNHGIRDFLAAVLDARLPETFSPADLIAGFQHVLGARYVEGIVATCTSDGLPTRNLCLTGGCALNIVWNSMCRARDVFTDVWVPPFPNDAGSAIGAAAVGAARAGDMALQWDVYSGPLLDSTSSRQPGFASGWRPRRSRVSLEELGELLATTGEPVVFLQGRAELGPRALGHRSILAPATSPAMTDRLNTMKRREPYRPVAPVCLEAFARDVFAPGTRDPYMLFSHDVRPAWRARIPAVVHVDGSARLQTIAPTDDTALHAVLSAYHACTGLPVLCNTSANLKGRGFFPDAHAAMEWGQTNYVWADGVLYESERRVDRAPVFL